MATSKKKEDNRVAVALHQQSGRESVLFARRHLDSSSNSSSQTSTITNDEFQIIVQSLQKPNNPRCFDALKLLNSLFFDISSQNTQNVQNQWFDGFFAGGDKIIHNLVGVFTNFNLENAQIQVEAGVCLANLCCTNDQKQKFVLSRLVCPYLVIFLADGKETTRISLAISCLNGLGNLAVDSKGNKKLLKIFISQHALEAVFSMIGHNDQGVQEAGLFALESIILAITGSKDESIIGSSIIRSLDQKLVSIIFEILDKFEKNVGQCARIIWILSCQESIFRALKLDQIKSILSAIDKSKSEWQLGVLIPLWRSIGMILGNENVVFPMELVSILVDLSIEFLRSPYVPLRKETLWVLSNFLVDRNHRQILIDQPARFLEPLVSTVVEVGTISLCKDIVRFCVMVLYKMVCGIADQEVIRRSISGNLRKLIDVIGLRKMDEVGIDDQMHVMVCELAKLASYQ